MEVDSILNGYSASINNPTDVTEFINDTLLPTVDLLMQLNSKAANDFLGDVYNMFYSFEKQSNGSYIAKLDYNKLKSLNELLATPPASEVIDMYFGENTVKIIVAFSEQILDLEPSEIPAYLDANRVDSDKIIDAINKLFATMEDVPEGFDIEDMLNSKEFEGYTLGMLLFGNDDDSYTDLFDEFVNSLNEKSIYELYYPENANELKDNINKTLDTYAETFSISLIINRSGELVSENCNINNFT